MPRLSTSSLDLRFRVGVGRVPEVLPPGQERVDRESRGMAWAQRFGPVTAIGVESTGSYAAGLVRHLRAQGLEVLEVNQPHAHTRRRRGKSDPIDAEVAARHMLAENSVVIAKDTTRTVESIRQLRVASDGAVKARSAALNVRGAALLEGRRNARICW